MRHCPTLAAVVCLPLLACGGPDPDEGLAPKPDLRQQLLGTYEATGTLTVIIQGVSNSKPMSETLVLQSSDSQEELSLELTTLGCGLSGKMSGERGFVLQGRACTLPANDDCTFTLRFTGGSGVKQGEDLGVSLQANLITRCGNRTTATPYSLELSGSRKQ